MVNTVSLVIVDDDPLVRAGLKLILGASPELSVLGEATDGDEVEALVKKTSPDIVLMDIRMPRMDGLSAAKRLLAKPDAPKIIVLTTFDADDMILQALALGAQGFLLKDTPPERMVEAIRQVAAGEHTLSPRITSQVIAAATRTLENSRQEEALAEIDALSEREKEIAVAIGQGKSNAEIASELYMSVGTVKAHVTHIFYKLDVVNRVQIAMKVHDAGMV